MATSSRQLRCIVVTPERSLMDVPADSITLPMFDGELGVLPGRAPLIGRLGFGDLRFRSGGGVHHLYVDGGFVQIRDNVVTVLTSRAMKADEIKVPDAEQALAAALAAQKKAVGPDAQKAQLVAQDKARAQIRVADQSA